MAFWKKNRYNEAVAALEAADITFRAYHYHSSTGTMLRSSGGGNRDMWKIELSPRDLGLDSP